MRRILVSLTILAVALAALAAPTAGTAAPRLPAGYTGPSTLPRPVADDPALRGRIAPVRGTVAGMPATAARAATKGAAAAFRRTRDDPGSSAGDVAPADTLHTAWGVFPSDSAGQGMAADDSVIPNLTLSGSEFLYAPTTKPPSGSCAELTTAYTPDGAYLWAWDWCVSDGPAKTVAIDDSFAATYTATVNGDPAYSMREIRTDAASNTWTIYLYNYTSHAWDVFYQQSGTDILNIDYGWDTFEVYTTPPSSGADGPYCAAIAGHAIESSGIQLYDEATGAWTDATPGNAPGLNPVPSGSAFDCPALHFSVPVANSDWLATA